MRADIHFKLICSICGNELEADTQNSKMEYHSAYNAEANMAIIPCKTCYNKAMGPARLMAKALNGLKDIDLQG